MTFLTVCCLTGVGYFLGSGGGVRVGGVVVKGAGEIEKRYRGIVRRLGSRGDFVAGAVKFCEDVTGDVCGEGEEGKERLLPEFVDSNGAGVVSAVPLSVVMSRLEKEEEELPALPVENGGGSSSSGVGGFLGSFFKASGSSTETKKEETEKFNEYDVLDEILRKAKELPALPIEDSDKEKKKGKGKGKGLGGPKSTPKKVVKKPAAKQLPQVKNPKETSVEILSDSVSNEEEEEELELDNMDRLLSAPDLIAPSERTESENQTIVHTGDTEFSVVSNKSSVSNLKEEQSLRTMTVSDQILGHGSHGTMVFKGTFEGRPVAIKRLLLDFYDVAHHEVKILRDSDQHQNVIRYFYQEATEKFMYIALELCPASLADVVENTTNPDLHQIRLSLKPRNVLSQIISGIQYLHSLKLVHRDIKPQNILIGESRGKLNSHPRILITDFGLCKRLADDQSSFHNTMHTTGGTIGWRAPECMINQAGAKPGSQEDTSESDHSQWVLLAPSQQM
ncbi:bifunctional endoribonuclease/protein kinase ire1, partial [Rhizoclosmatium hyalinum]